MAVALLIIEDEPSIRQNLAAYMEDEGMDIVACSSGEEALAIVESGQQADVCIVNIRLPDMDGNETIRELLRVRPSLRFLIHTGQVDYELPEDLCAAGIEEDDVFVKPVLDPGNVASAVKRLAFEER